MTFTVPEDSKLVFFYFGGEQGATLNEAPLTPARRTAAYKLGYKLLPAFIADRIQDPHRKRQRRTARRIPSGRHQAVENRTSVRPRSGWL